MKLNNKSMDNFHFRGHAILFIFLIGLLAYGYWIKDYLVILMVNALLIRPINVIAKKIFKDHKYYLKSLLSVLALFAIGYLYYDAKENKLLAGVFVIMFGFQTLSVLEYYIDKFKEKNKIT